MKWRVLTLVATVCLVLFGSLQVPLPSEAVVTPQPTGEIYAPPQTVLIPAPTRDENDPAWVLLVASIIFPWGQMTVPEFLTWVGL